MINKTATPRTDKVIRENATSNLPGVLTMHAIELKQEVNQLFDALVGIMDAPNDGGIITSDAIFDAQDAINTVKALRAGE